METRAAAFETDYPANALSNSKLHARTHSFTNSFSENGIKRIHFVARRKSKHVPT